MPRKGRGTGDRALDVEIDALWAEIDRLKSTSTSQSQPNTVELVREVGNLRVENVSSNFFGLFRGILFDDTDGVTLTEEGDHVRVDLLPTIVRKNSTGSEYTRRRLNLIEGSNITLTVADDSTDNEVDVTIAAASGGSGAWSFTGSSSTSITFSLTSAPVDVLDCQSSSAVTVTLPSAATAGGGKVIAIKREAAVNSVTINRAGSETIDNATSKTLGSQYATIALISDGSNWKVLWTYGTVT